MTAALGLTDNQLGYARGIVTAVKARGWELKGAVIAVEVAIAESGLQMYANGNNPESLLLPHDKVGWDHGSVGLFQQQVGGAVNSTANWGTTGELMDPIVSTSKFLNEMDRRMDWRHLDNWVAAQNVQGSAYDGNPRQANNFNSEYGGNYHAQDARATQIATAIWNEGEAPSSGGGTPIPEEDMTPEEHAWLSNLNSRLAKIDTMYTATVNSILPAVADMRGRVIAIQTKVDLDFSSDTATQDAINVMRGQLQTVYAAYVNPAGFADQLAAAMPEGTDVAALKAATAKIFDDAEHEFDAAQIAKAEADAAQTPEPTQ